MGIRKRRIFSHVVIHVFMFFSGVEYAIIFPTLWEYLQSLGVQSSQTYWLGLGISAMTVTDIISSLVIGMIVDQRNKFRLLVLGLNLFQVGGAVIYLFSSSPPLILVARLVSGCGKSLTVVFLADICKATKKEDRTPILLTFNVASQIGLLVGPAVNLVLQDIDLKAGFFTLNKLNSPGLVMVVLWAVFFLLVLFLYTELVQLQSEEMLSDQLYQGYTRSETFENLTVYSDISQDRLQLEVDGEDLDRENPHNISFFKGDFFKAEAIRTRMQLDGWVDSVQRSPDAKVGSYPCTSSGILQAEPEDLPVEPRRHSISSFGSPERDYSRGECLYNSIYQLRRNTLRSDKYILEADRIMGESIYSSSDLSSIHSTGRGDIYDEEREDHTELTWRDYRHTILRREILVLILIRFIALFCQTSLESIVPPLLTTVFKYSDTAVSYLYLAAGLQLVVMYIGLSLLSRCVSDRTLVKAGMAVLFIALFWHTLTIPRFRQDDSSSVLYFGIGVFLELVGIPTVCDIGLALYSKLLPENVQGFSHGLRRFLCQLAVLVGPLWGTGTLALPWLLTLLPLVLQFIALVLFLLSFSKMKTDAHNPENANETTPLLHRTTLSCQNQEHTN